MKTNETGHEVVVAGGGMVGAALALALAQAGFLVLVIDPAPPAPAADDAPPDLRVSAISCASTALLRHIGAWQRLDERFCVPYRRLETWEWPSSVVAFDAASLNLTELGFMVENRRLQHALWQGFTDCDALTLRCSASLAAMAWDDGRWQLTLDDGSSVTSRLVVGADGANSWVRQHSGIAVSGWQYRQSCLLLSVAINGGQQQNVTWQAFHPSGPRAFLPLYGRWASLVWYDSAARIRQLGTLPLQALAREVQAAFPDRLGAFTLHGAASFPLTRLHARDYVLPGLALIGDAAHTINPLAGQGANLGFRDADALAEVLIAARDRGERWETLAVLQRYQRRRRGDNLLMQAGMDAFYTTFSNDLPPLMLARNLGLMLAQRAGGLKHRVLRYALGL
ncbi:2-octaprenyl-3-methyl-6-methoxy-1,4-benzoquinol hydroxylase [Sodalis-like symbiont of Philaenus spumarius]|nr:2-octaprenyl-3-methyl-6-methoxy-1,4-benzoquinol hydroxylase [Sodalis-like symbiont of Philaenus spumarius]OZI15523.1 2-octaprenyl-3-methyl-6-methoxy-1,4-benzoquinol hydroxylase [Sodalis-like symbiont of Philaenus spumarius]